MGFIGSNLALRLCEYGADVTLVDSMTPEYGGNLFNISPIADRVRVCLDDIRDERAMQQLIDGQDYLFNLAGQTSHIDSMKNPQQDMEVNVRAQLAMMEACRNFNLSIRVVYASTRQIYGKPEYLPVDEQHPLNPVDINGINKLAGEMYHLLYSRVHGLKASVLRLTNTYGPRMRIKDDRQTFLGTWIHRLLSDEPLRIFGDGKQLRDFNYVEDVLDALLLCASSNKTLGKIYNLGSTEVIDLATLARRMIEVHGAGSYELIDFPPDRKRIDIGDYYGDCSLIQRELGWTPRVDLATGLAHSLEYFDKFREHYWPCRFQLQIPVAGSRLMPVTLLQYMPRWWQVGSTSSVPR
jgi:UDP-glucose 4-epimerase